MTIPSVSTWFSSDRRATDLGGSDFILGSTHLLCEFLERAASMPTGRRLLIVAPFLDEALVEDNKLFTAECVVDSDLLLITTPSEARGGAVRAMTALPWRSCEVRALRGLHSKLYVVLPPGGTSLALLGSHNLTLAAANSNMELGILITGASTAANQLIADLYDHILDLRRRAKVAYDSLHPLSQAA